MLQTGVIEHSNSPWSSAVCMVRKKDGCYRYCVDYRRMNFVTIKDAFPVPDVKDALDSLRGAKYFATIDLLSGYWQLGMTQRARERSAFCTRRGLYQFTRMPFGLSNAPASFCRLMQIILHDLLYVCCICYLDYIWKTYQFTTPCKSDEVTHPKQHKSFFWDNVIERSHCTYNPLGVTPLDVTW